MAMLPFSGYAAVSYPGDQAGSWCSSGFTWCTDMTGTFGCCAPMTASCGNGAYCKTSGGGGGAGTGGSATCTQKFSCTGSASEINSVSNCAVSSTSCYGDAASNPVVTCTRCLTGYDMTAMYISLDGDCRNVSIQYYTCTKDDGGDEGGGGGDGGGGDIGTICQNCTNSAGVCTMISPKCCPPCDESAVVPVEYCPAGQYGFSASNCQPCPVGPNGESTTSIKGQNRGITGCYIAAGTEFSDDTGSGVYVEKCSYSLI